MVKSPSRGRSVLVGALWVLVVALLMAPVEAHLKNGTRHVWKAHIKPKLAKEGTINKPKNPVHWTRLKGVPAGFEDGIDIGGGGGGAGGGTGDITGVAAGTGLTGGGTDGDVSLGVDTSVVQARVTGSCPQQESIRTIAPDGTAECEPDDRSAGYSGFKNGPALVPQPAGPIGTLNLPPGDYVIFAKLWVVPDTNGEATVKCTLAAGGSSDDVRIDAGPREADHIGLNVVHSFSSPGAAVVSCGLTSLSNPNTDFEDLRITAVSVNGLSNVGL
jgi:hypothetical protein